MKTFRVPYKTVTSYPSCPVEIQHCRLAIVLILHMSTAMT